jgi:hypothetical protein
MRTEWVAEPEALYGVEPSEGLLALALPHERFRPHPLLGSRLGPDLNSPVISPWMAGFFMVKPFGTRDPYGVGIAKGLWGAALHRRVGTQPCRQVQN